MKISEKNIKTAAEAALLSCFTKVPFLKVIDIQKEYDEKDTKLFPRLRSEKVAPAGQLKPFSVVVTKFIQN